MKRYYLVEELKIKDDVVLKYLFSDFDLKKLNNYFVFLQSCYPEKNFLIIKEVFYNACTSNG